MPKPSSPYDKAIQHLQQLIEEAVRRGLPESNSATLATADRASGRPSVRTVYVLNVDVEGLVIFASTQSGKARQMQDNPQAALCFFWPALQSQVVVDGEVELLSEADSDAYWRKRSRESQLGAWVMESAATGDSRELKDKLAQYKAEFSFEQAPRPQHWRAFRIRPTHIEFWKTGWQRLLGRTGYQKQADGSWREHTHGP